MVSFHQFHTWNQRPLYLYIQHHGLLLSIPYMRPGITICIYNTMVSFSPSPYMRPYSFCRPLYLSIQHHGLFAPIPNMLTMDHYICLYSIMVSSHQFHTWEQGPLLLSIRFHVLFSPIPYMKKETPLSIYNTMISSHRFHTRDQGPLYLPIHYHGLFLPIIYMRTWTTLSLYTTPWSLLTNSIHEIMDHSICLYNTVVSSHQFHTWDQGSLSVYTTPWSLLTNFIHETMDHSLSIQHYGLFSPVSYMSPVTTLSVYTTPSSHLGISEKRPWCCIDRVLYGLELVWTDHDVVYTEWSMVSCMELAWRDHVVYR
jgi:hypothetical protein